MYEGLIKDKNICMHITWHQCDIVEGMEGEEMRGIGLRWMKDNIKRCKMSIRAKLGVTGLFT